MRFCYSAVRAIKKSIGQNTWTPRPTKSVPHGAVGDRIGALRIAARFSGIGAHNNADFYRQLGKIPEQIVRDAVDVLGKRFNLY